MENRTPNGYAWDIFESVRDASMQCDSYTVKVCLLFVDKLIEELEGLGESVISNHKKVRINYLKEVKKELYKIKI